MRGKELGGKGIRRRGKGARGNVERKRGGDDKKREWRGREGLRKESGNRGGNEFHAFEFCQLESSDISSY